MHKCATMMNIGAPYFVKSTDVCHVTERRERPKQKIKRKEDIQRGAGLRGELRNTTGTWRSSTAVSCFPLTFPAVSALLGCEGRRVGCGGGVFLDVGGLVSDQVINVNFLHTRAFLLWNWLLGIATVELTSFIITHVWQQSFTKVDCNQQETRKSTLSIVRMTPVLG